MLEKYTRCSCGAYHITEKTLDRLIQSSQIPYQSITTRNSNPTNASAGRINVAAAKAKILAMRFWNELIPMQYGLETKYLRPISSF
jgi:hypothetical protein